MHYSINKLIQEAWKIISPVWPLENFIATNPLSGFEELNFHQAIAENKKYQLFASTIKDELSVLNQHTIKWCQAFFDEGQASLGMPYREKGFFYAWKKLNQNNKKLPFFKNLPSSAEKTILFCLDSMNITQENHVVFLKLILITLKGWSGYVKYQAEWSVKKYSSLMTDYLAIRLALCAILCEDVNDWISIYEKKSHSLEEKNKTIKILQDNECYFQKKLLKSFGEVLKDSSKEKNKEIKKIQCVFCIDVRSEPFRKALEKQENYETFGFAGFFAAPVAIQKYDKYKPENDCPVLLSPTNKVREFACSPKQEKRDQKGKRYLQRLNNLYCALKYNISTPCGLAETLGPWMGIWMALQTFIPLTSQKIKKSFLMWFRPSIKKSLSIDEIDLETKVAWSETLLSMLNLSNQLSPIVILCGHGSTTVNNAYASALDCGACGANKGGYNAYLMAMILNEKEVRIALNNRGIFIPESTYFVGAEHNTTTDEFIFFNLIEPYISEKEIIEIKNDFSQAKKLNLAWRHQQLILKDKFNLTTLEKRSADWAQTRPEWGLAGNSAFIVAPRNLTKSINLEGKAFLHSYDWENDPNGSHLTTIMTAPMIVAQWINHQYLFSSLDNNAYGSGSKITHNITGKIGVMQGNASDLMSGLSLQSLYSSDDVRYHKPQRLMVVIYAPKKRIENIIQKNPQLKNLFFNEWIFLYAIEPTDNTLYFLSSEKKLSILWRKYHA